MKKNKLVIAALLAFYISGLPVFPQAKEIIDLPDSVFSHLPDSPAARSGNILFISGQVGIDSSGELVKGGIKVQTQKAIENLKTVLEADGMTLDNVISTKVYLADSRFYREMNEVYAQAFSHMPPTRATLEADLELEGSLIKIQAIAISSELTKQPVTVPDEGPNMRPYSRALRAGNYLFLAGLISQDLATGEFVPGDIVTQTHQALDNASKFVQAAGFSMSDFTVSSVFLSDSRDFAAMNEVYQTYFGDIPPTRATVRTRLMNPEAKVEIMLWGLKGKKKRLGRQSRILSSGIQVGNTVFLSGFVRGDRSLRGDVPGQTRAVLKQAQIILSSAGMDLADIINSNIFLTDVRNFRAMNDVYKLMLNKNPPPRTIVGTDLMSTAGLIEIAMIASKD